MYLALYRKYRPRTFDEVISQEHITTTLKNQVLNGLVGHAYLFTGSRGTGKTSCAKILAMALNCENPQNGNPCLECERCREILEGTTTDIVEMDAASNNGVDDVRSLRDEVAYTPVSCKYRVYIIDEVHMLSISAFNALLKTLEEPPEHVKFILATTELHKVPATISSRCQRFEFRRVDAADSAERLLEVAEKESVRLERGAAELIARLSDGGMRDALSILDRCVSAGTDITPQTVRDCAGVADDAHLFALSEMIARHDTAGCIRVLGELHKGSKDIALIIDEMSGHFRDMMLYKTAPNDRELLNVLPDEQDKLFAIADTYTLEEILRCLTLLQQCADGIGKIKQRKTLAEMCFVKMCAGIGAEAPNIAARSAVPSQAARPGGIQFREIPDEKPPVRQRDESELSVSERVQSARSRTLLAETAKLVADSQAAESEVKKSEPQVTRVESTPIAPDPKVNENEPVIDSALDDAPPYGEPPPDYAEYGAPPEYEPAPDPEFGNSDREALSGTGHDGAKPAKVDDNIPAPSEAHESQRRIVIDEDNAARIASLTQEQWEEAISKTSFMVKNLLGGSVISADGDVLAVSSNNRMLLKSVKGKEIAEFEKEISRVLGFSVHIKIVQQTAEENSTPGSPLEVFLAKCRGRGIDVTIKD